MKQQVSFIAILILLLGVFAAGSVSAQQSAITLSVQPQEYQAIKKGEVFSINVSISNVNETQHLVGLNFRVSYNDTLLEVLGVTEGPFLKQFPQTSTEPYTFFVYYIENRTTFPNGTIIPPHILIGLLLLPNSTGQWPGPFPEGGGVLATIKFRSINQTVEPQPPLKTVFHIFDVTLIDDTGAELPYNTEDGYYEIEPLTFAYQPLRPTVGQEVVFDVSKQTEPTWVTNCKWHFGDGTTITSTTNPVKHVFNATGLYNVTLEVTYIDNTTLTVSRTIEISAYSPFEIKIDAASLFFRGEICEYNILTTYLGRAVNSQLTATLYFNGNLYANLTGNIQSIETGFYRIPYTIPGTAEAGTYTLLVKAEYNGISNMEIKSFYISDSLASMNATISSIQQDLANVVIPNLGIIKLNLTEVNATVTSIKENTVTINTSIGDLKSDIQGLNGSISGLNSTVKNTEDKVNEVKGTSNTILTLLYATLILAIIAIVAAVMATYFARKASK